MDKPMEISVTTPEIKPNSSLSPITTEPDQSSGRFSVASVSETKSRNKENSAISSQGPMDKDDAAISLSNPGKNVKWDFNQDDAVSQASDMVDVPTIQIDHPSIQHDDQKLDTLLTVERVPSIDNYRNADSMGGPVHSRPTLLELHDEDCGEAAVKDAEYVVNMMVDDLLPKQNPNTNEEEEEKPKSCETEIKREKFGWVQGVFMRCVLNILGVMLYLRLSWVAGQAGIGLGSGVVLLASLVTTLTTISMCAISTNGDVKGGGAYFMISRALGPEFGGSIGLMFSFANAVGAAMYIVGFSETVRDIMKEHATKIVDGSVNDIRIVSLGVAVLLLIVVCIGVSFEAKAQFVLLVVLSVSYANFVIGTFIPPTEDQASKGVTGYTWLTFSTNFFPSFRDGESFISVFSVFFPAATGIMAGANISGDLRNPQQSIPKGTLLAILITTIVYLSGLWLTGATCVRDAAGPDPSLLESSYFPIITDEECKSNNTCQFGLMNYSQIMELESVWGPLVTAGIFAATLSSALSSLVSAPKVFQAVCKDRLFPYIEFFAHGYGKADEPRRGYILAFTIAVAMILIGDLNAIAPIISNFFLAAYALINYSCFDASFSQSIGFRPAFKYYNMWVSLFGAVVCVGVMFIINWWTALLTLGFVLMLYVYILRRKPDVNWGSSGQAHSYKDALHSMLKLAQTEDHVKNYRPQILVLSGNPVARPSIVDFVSNITKENSLLICGHVIVHPTPERLHGSLLKLRDKIAPWLFKRKTKAFYLPVASKSLPDGAAHLLQLSGLGKLRPNIVVLGYKNNWIDSDIEEINGHVNIIHAAFDGNYSVGILRVADGLDFSDQMKSYNHEDVVHLAVPEPEKLYRRDESYGKLSRVSSFARRSKSPDPLEAGERRRSRSPTDHDSFLKKKLSFFSKETGEDSQQGQPEPLLLRRRDDGAEDQGEMMKCMENAHRKLLSNINQFKLHEKKVNTLDVWWLYDDGGLSLLIPHLLTCGRSYLEGCKLRIFTIGSSRSALEQEQRSMAGLLTKFRIDYSDVFVLPDVTKQPRASTIEEFYGIIEKFRCRNSTEDSNQTSSGFITDSELMAHQEKSNRQMRIRELLIRNSKDASLICLTLPVPRKGVLSSCLYMAWLELLTKDMPPVLLLRGNQQSVLTFYS